VQKPAASLLVIVYAATALLAQNSLLHGIVTDDSGAVVPGATVTLAGPAGLEKTAVTGGDGSYTFPLSRRAITWCKRPHRSSPCRSRERSPSAQGR